MLTNQRDKFVENFPLLILQETEAMFINNLNNVKKYSKYRERKLATNYN